MIRESAAMIARYPGGVRTLTLPTLPVPICRIIFDPQTRCYAFAFNFEGQRVHHTISTFDSIEQVKRWADPWAERIWEEPSDADELTLLVSRCKKPGAL